MAAFPSYMKLILAGLAFEREGALTRTDMEIGPPKQAVQKTRVMLTRKVTYAADTKTDYLNFIAWHKTTINYGVAWFDWTDPVDGVTKKARIVNGKLDEEKPLNSGLTLWQVTFHLETWV